MIYVAIYGNGKESQKLKDLLENEYSDILEQNSGERIQVAAYVWETDQEAQMDIKVKSILQFAEDYKLGKASAIILPKEYFITYNSVVFELIKAEIDVNDIYNGIRLFDGIENDMEYMQHLITPMLEDPYLSYLEYHVTDHCNLNCKYCTHYSPLVKTPVFIDFDRFKKGLAQLRSYISDIGVIRILGGEPLLNPQLPQFIEYTRKLFPGAIIYVVTNGLLIQQLKAELIETMKKCIAFFHISYYPPLEHKIAEIQHYLVKQGISYTMSPLITHFNKTQSLSENGEPDFFYSCFQASCTCIHEGKIAPCYTPFMTKYFNEAFGQELPTDEGIDLFDEELGLQALKLRLLIPMERCRFCIDGESQKWQCIGKNSCMEDWV